MPTVRSVLYSLALSCAAAACGATTPDADAPVGLDASAGIDAPLRFDAPSGTLPDGAALDAKPSSTSDALSVDAKPVPDARPLEHPDARAGVTPTALRLTSLHLVDPHAWILFLGVCFDATGTLNAQIDGALNRDDSPMNAPDGELDLSVLGVFEPLSVADQSQTPFELVFGTCTAPKETTTCSATSQDPRYGATVTSRTSGTCLDTIPNTLGNYPAPKLPEGPCFSSDEQDLQLVLAGVNIALTHAQVAAQYVNGGSGLTKGLVRGFLSRAQADRIVVPIPLVGDRYLTELLYGSGRSCKDDTTRGDLDVGPDGVTEGWWLYAEFTAAQAPYQER